MPTTQPSNTAQSSRTYNTRSSASDVEPSSHGTFSSSLTSLDTGDDDAGATQCQWRERAWECGSTTSCRSMFTDHLEYPLDESCRSLSEYICDTHDGDAYDRDFEWHESRCLACHAQGHTRGSECYLDGETPRLGFPLSNMRTPCIVEPSDDLDAPTYSSESRPLSLASDLEHIPSFTQPRHPAQHATIQILSAHSDASSLDSWSYGSEQHSNSLTRGSSGSCSVVETEFESISDSLTASDESLSVWSDTILVSTPENDTNAEDFDIKFLIPSCESPLGYFEQFNTVLEIAGFDERQTRF